MNCHNIQNRLSAYQDGELIGEDRERIRTHLEGCPACRQELTELEGVWKGLENLGEIEPEPQFYGKLQKRLKEEHTPPFLPRLQGAFHLFPNPKFLFVCLLVGLLLGTYMGNILMGNALWPLPRYDSGYSREVTLAALDAFDPMPPGTLAQGYVQLASYGADVQK